MMINTLSSGHRYCIAPMMDWTDRHDRFFLRLISKKVRLYTEMVTAQAIQYGDQSSLLAYNPEEHPLALQLGGCDPKALAECARLAEDRGFDEVNLNVGCPSERVQKGAFGACLMAEPQLVAECVDAMKNVCTIPITVKTRIGIDHQDSEEFLMTFMNHMVSANVDLVIIHARKAWLSGLSPKENREKPPLNYQRVLAVKNQWPDLPIIINGGIQSAEQALSLINQGLNGVMIGRTAYQKPFTLSEVDQLFFNCNHQAPSRAEIIEAFTPYMEQFVKTGQPLKRITRHITGLFHGQPGARHWRRTLSESQQLTPRLVLQTAQELEHMTAERTLAC